MSESDAASTKNENATTTPATTEALTQSIKSLAKSSAYARKIRKGGLTNLTTDQATDLDKSIREAQSQLHVLSKAFKEWAKEHEWTRPSKTTDDSKAKKEDSQAESEAESTKSEDKTE
ncbi:hypothetical protein IAR50_005786 [Cryptococcus sp. DSM 104548]